MKTHIKVPLLALVLFSTLIPQLPTCFAQGTAFTYQASLAENGAAANGVYDLRFRLFPSSAGGFNALGTVSLEDVGVTNGLFTVSLDFGSSVFSGSDRWLEIGVRPGQSSGAYTNLVPRTSITAAPYAVFAFSGNEGPPGPQGEQGEPGSPGGLWSLNGSTAYYNENVSVGSSSALARLTVTPAVGPGGLQKGIYVRHTDTSNQSITAQFVNDSTDGTAVWAQSTATNGPSRAIFASSASPSGTAVFGQALHTTGNNYGVRGETESFFGSGVYGLSKVGFAYGVYGETKTGNGRAVGGYASANSGSGIAVYGEALSPSGWAGWFYGRGYFRDAVGIGTASPSAKLHVVDDTSTIVLSAHSSATSGSHYGVVSDVDSSSSYAGFFVGGRNYFGGNVGIGVVSPSVSLHVDGGSDASLAAGSGYLQVGATSGNNIIIDSNEIIARNNGVAGNLHLNAHGGNVTIGTSSGGSARLITPVIEITGGSDLSEQFGVNGNDLKPGTVVCIDPDQPGNLLTSTRSYDRTVAGIISGAGGIQTGMLMGQRDSVADGAHPVALTGRVYCLVDAGQGTIRPGDLITTSDTPGHGMKATDHNRAQGAILGKAMSSLDSGQGLVLVLVSLQ